MPVPPEVTKTVTIESGFQRPAGGWSCLTTSSILEAEAAPEAANDSQPNDDEDNDDDHSESSSLPSESSGIFYR